MISLSSFNDFSLSSSHHLTPGRDCMWDECTRERWTMFNSNILGIFCISSSLWHGVLKMPSVISLAEFPEVRIRIGTEVGLISSTLWQGGWTQDAICRQKNLTAVTLWLCARGQACSSHCKHMNTWRGGDKMTICTQTKHNHVLDRATCQVISGGSTSYFFCGLNPRYQDHLSRSPDMPPHDLDREADNTIISMAPDTHLLTKFWLPCCSYTCDTMTR